MDNKLDEKLARIAELIELKKNTEAELFALIGGGDYQKKERKPLTCGICQSTGHTARNCDSRKSALPVMSEVERQE